MIKKSDALLDRLFDSWTSAGGQGSKPKPEDLELKLIDNKQKCTCESLCLYVLFSFSSLQA